MAASGIADVRHHGPALAPHLTNAHHLTASVRPSRIGPTHPLRQRLSAQASNGETTLTFTVLAGIVVGGTSILGGEGAI